MRINVFAEFSWPFLPFKISTVQLSLCRSRLAGHNEELKLFLYEFNWTMSSTYKSFSFWVSTNFLSSLVFEIYIWIYLFMLMTSGSLVGIIFCSINPYISILKLLACLQISEKNVFFFSSKKKLLSVFPPLFISSF